MTNPGFQLFLSEMNKVRDTVASQHFKPQKSPVVTCAICRTDVPVHQVGKPDHCNNRKCPLTPRSE